MFPQSGAFTVKIITPHLLLFVTTVPVLFLPVCCSKLQGSYLINAYKPLFICLSALSKMLCLGHGCINRPGYGVAGLTPAASFIPAANHSTATQEPLYPETISLILHWWQDTQVIKYLYWAHLVSTFHLSNCSLSWNTVSSSLPWSRLEDRKQPQLTTVPTIQHC